MIAAAPAGAAPVRDFVASRPPEAEERAIERAAGADPADRLPDARRAPGQRRGAAAHPAAKAEGLPVTAETCPHYLTLRAEDVPDGATQFKCCPPIRDDANREALWAGLLDGTIDCVVSDHSPCPVAAKRLDTGDFGAAWGGIASLQLGLPVVWTGRRARRRPGRAGAVDGRRPAALAGLTDRGGIAVGRRADLVRARPGRDVRRRPGRTAAPQPSPPTPGRTLRGVVRQTWLAGAPVSRDPRAGRPARP